MSKMESRLKKVLKEEPPKPTLNIDGLAEFIIWRVKLAAEAAMPLPKKLEFVSQKELGIRLGISPPTVIGLRKKGIIHGVQIGNKWRFEIGEVWSALKQHGKMDEDESPTFENGSK